MKTRLKKRQFPTKRVEDHLRNNYSPILSNDRLVELLDHLEVFWDWTRSIKRVDDLLNSALLFFCADAIADKLVGGMPTITKCGDEIKRLNALLSSLRNQNEKILCQLLPPTELRIVFSTEELAYKLQGKLSELLLMGDRLCRLTRSKSNQRLRYFRNFAIAELVKEVFEVCRMLRHRPVGAYRWVASFLMKLDYEKFGFTETSPCFDPAYIGRIYRSNKEHKV